MTALAPFVIPDTGEPSYSTASEGPGATGPTPDVDEHRQEPQPRTGPIQLPRWLSV